MNKTLDDLSVGSLCTLLEYLLPRDIYNVSAVFPKNSPEMFRHLQRNYLMDKNGLLDFDKLSFKPDSPNKKQAAENLSNRIINITRFPYNNSSLEIPRSVKLTLNENMGNKISFDYRFNYSLERFHSSHEDITTFQMGIMMSWMTKKLLKYDRFELLMVSFSFFFSYRKRSDFSISNCS